MCLIVHMFLCGAAVLQAPLSRGCGGFNLGPGMAEKLHKVRVKEDGSIYTGSFKQRLIAIVLNSKDHATTAAYIPDKSLLAPLWLTCVRYSRVAQNRAWLDVLHPKPSVAGPNLDI